MYRISRYSRKELDAVLELWVNNGYCRGIIPSDLRKHLEWKYNRRFSRLWIAKEHARVLGTCGAITRPLFVRGQGWISGNWGMDSLVDNLVKKTSRNFIFFRVFRQALLADYREKKRLLTFSFPNNVVKDTYLKIGWRNAPVFQEYSRSLASGSFRNGLKYLGDFELGGLRFSKIDTFEPGWNKVWDNMCVQYVIAGSRRSEYLNWRYFRSPSRQYFAYICRDKNLIKGFLVFKNEITSDSKCGSLVDFLFLPVEKALWETTMVGALLILKSRGARKISIYTTFKLLKDSLTKLGFQAGKFSDYFVFSKEEKLIKNIFSGINNWLVSSGDGDFEME